MRILTVLPVSKVALSGTAHILRMKSEDKVRPLLPGCIDLRLRESKPCLGQTNARLEKMFCTCVPGIDCYERAKKFQRSTVRRSPSMTDELLWNRGTKPKKESCVSRTSLQAAEAAS